jgi:CubicO group peptidase (beta-lactamase class C family)
LTDTTPTQPRWKRRLFRVLATLLLLHFVVEITGHHYLYTTLQRTVLRGSLSPDIQEYRNSANAEIEAGEPQPWPQSTRYGITELSADDDAYHQEHQSVSFLVIHRDSVLFENHWDDFGPDTLSNSFSMAKSIVGLLAGVALAQGHISDIDQPIHYHLPEYNYEPANRITTRHLLAMSSGIKFNESYLNPFAFPARANYGNNLDLLVDEYRCTEEPGVHHDYQSGTTQILAELIRTASRYSLSEYASEFVWKKIGAEHSALWSKDRADGVEKAFCCINATARDFARIGKLY